MSTSRTSIATEPTTRVLRNLWGSLHFARSSILRLGSDIFCQVHLKSMLGHYLYIVSCTPEDCYFWVVWDYIFVLMLMHMYVPNYIFIKTIMWHIKWKAILAFKLDSTFPWLPLKRRDMGMICGVDSHDSVIVTIPIITHLWPCYGSSYDQCCTCLWPFTMKVYLFCGDTKGSNNW